MKISVVMQSYLGEYPGSRKDADLKFIRAVNSFMDQTDKDSELIIVSDSCKITHELYYSYFKQDNRIKYAYVDRDQQTMNLEKKYYRGFPRQVGRALATGDLISYMDSDDYLVPTAIEIIKKYWNDMLQVKSYTFSMCTSWYGNKKSIKVYEGSDAIEASTKLIKFKNLPDEWSQIKMKKHGHVIRGTFSIVHVNNIKTKWMDVYDENISEDNKFIDAVYLEGPGFAIDKPYYVICHQHGGWDL
jgi:glycosyltransferase involved in cell wall biosynthesis